MSYSDIFRVLEATPVPTALVIIGFVALSVGFGLRIRVVVNVDRINKTYAKAVGLVLLVTGVLLYLSNLVSDVFSGVTKVRDPFLIDYVVAGSGIVFIYWATLKFTKGPVQLRATRSGFILVAALATVVVLWRALDVFFYVRGSGPRPIPLALYERHNYLPYFFLFATGVAAILFFIYAFTREPANTGNRIQIFNSFILSCIYLAICRLAWEIVDYVARTQIPVPPPLP
jgi:hypothetical protein